MEQLIFILEVTGINNNDTENLLNPALDLIQERLERLLTAVEQLVKATERQAKTAQDQQQTIQQFVGVLAEQAIAITELTQTVREAGVGSPRGVQASQAAAMVAKNHQNTIRDLSQELRRSTR